MPNSVFFHEHNCEEIKAMADAGYAVVVPLASTEQHGPHLPVFTDSIITEHVITEAVSRAASSAAMIMTKMMPVGYSSLHHHFGGTISFSSSTYLNLLYDLGESLVTCGFRKIIYLNGHGGNEALMAQAINDLLVKYPIWAASATYWNVAQGALQEINAELVGLIPGHAGGFETSLILALRPDLVRQDHLQTADHPQRSWIGSKPARAFIGKHHELTGVDGYTDSANLASAEKGRQFLKVIIESLSKWLVNTCQTMNNN